MLFKSNTFLLCIFHCKTQTVLRKKKWTVEQQVTGKWKSRKVEKLMMHMVKFEKPQSRTVSSSTFHFLCFWNFVRCLSGGTCAGLFFSCLGHIPADAACCYCVWKWRIPPFKNGHCSWEISWSTSGFGWNITYVFSMVFWSPTICLSHWSKVSASFASSFVLGASSKRRSLQEFGARTVLKLRNLPFFVGSTLW